ncbi:unannotated protein [freshwater metagenome]|uniref:Unannotated protein n=1 Tax=freshwater metagenome TaxID=449393 RepID=A0A6J6FPI9_9ZZZZ
MVHCPPFGAHLAGVAATAISREPPSIGPDAFTTVDEVDSVVAAGVVFESEQPANDKTAKHTAIDVPSRTKRPKGERGACKVYDCTRPDPYRAVAAAAVGTNSKKCEDDS